MVDFADTDTDAYGTDLSQLCLKYSNDAISFTLKIKIRQEVRQWNENERRWITHMKCKWKGESSKRVLILAS